MGKLIADISKHNDTVDIERMKKAGVAAVIIRAGYRTAKAGKVETDPKFQENIRKAEKAKMPAGVYWWTTSLSVAEAEAEADACIAMAQGHKLSFPIWLDLEFYNSKREGRADHISATARTTYALAFLERCKKRGYDAGVYCNPDFWNHDLVPKKLERYPRWIAHYGKAAGMECDIWQYTSIASGKTYGAGSRYIDLNRMYTDFPSGEKSKFAKDNNVPVKSATGNPYREPDLIVTSDLQARTKHVNFYTSAGEGVRHVQYELNRLGYDIGAAGIDGKAGKKTVSAIIQAQEEFGLPVDGLAGKDTLKALHSAKQRPQKKATKATESNQQKLAKTSKEVYGAVVKYSCRHKSGATTLAEIIKKKITTCSSSVTAALKLAGLMKKGKVGHTKPDGHGGKTKTTLQKAMYGLEYIDLSKFEVKKFFKKFKDLPEEWKEAGIVYVQDSNIDISAGNGEIFANNEGHDQMKDGRYIKTKVNKGYPLTHDILFALKPKG